MRNNIIDILCDILGILQVTIEGVEIQETELHLYISALVSVKIMIISGNFCYIIILTDVFVFCNLDSEI